MNDVNTSGRHALIGHSGFVGTNLLRQAKFNALYRSTDIANIAGQRFGRVICAGVSAVKWRANQDPEADWAGIQRLIEPLNQIEAREFVLISTVDVYPTPIAVDEATPIPRDQIPQAYGRHRLMLEDFVRRRFPRALILRLPGLFGLGLKKNILFDLLHGNRLSHINLDSAFQWYPLARLWADIETGLAAGLDIVNLAVEPVRSGEIISRYFPAAEVGSTADPTARYDMQTRHAATFGGHGAYIMDTPAVLDAIGRFLAQSG